MENLVLCILNQRGLCLEGLISLVFSMVKYAFMNERLIGYDYPCKVECDKDINKCKMCKIECDKLDRKANVLL